MARSLCAALHYRFERPGSSPAYHGPWSKGPNGNWTGNPSNAPIVKEILAAYRASNNVPPGRRLRRTAASADLNATRPNSLRP